jgi:hypothetical protein
VVEGIRAQKKSTANNALQESRLSEYETAFHASVVENLEKEVTE